MGYVMGIKDIIFYSMVVGKRQGEAKFETGD
jgi:hypothetical protein